jgi:O-antigen ligase
MVLVPWILFNCVTASSLLHPNMRSVQVEGATVLVPLANATSLPSTAVSSATIDALLAFNGFFIPAFNLLVAVRTRSSLRLLFAVFVANAVALAIFGTLQKLTHSPGLYFGAITPPNPKFFSTFLYHNHWAAFAILALTTCVGFVYYQATHGRYRDFFHSPAFGALALAIILAASLPLSASRSATALGILVALVATLHGLRLVLRSRSVAAGSRVLPLAIVAAVILSMAAIYKLAEPVLTPRLAQTQEQLNSFRATGSVGARAQLYADTWRMAMDKPVFGWGYGTYGTVFSRYNTLQSPEGLPQHYEDAHSDWLQSMAECGMVGSILKGALILVPLALIGLRRTSANPLASYSLLGCALILLYAWVEFPFGNSVVVLATWSLYFAGLRLTELEARERA